MDNALLLKEIYTLLSDDKIEKEDRVKLQNYFINKYYEVLKVCFDVSLNPNKLQYYIENNDINNKLTNALFIAKTIDNQKTYDILNYFCYNFIRIIKEKYY